MKRFEILERKPDRWCILDNFYDRVEVVRFTSHGYARLYIAWQLWETEHDAVLDAADRNLRGLAPSALPDPGGLLA